MATINLYNMFSNIFPFSPFVFIASPLLRPILSIYLSIYTFTVLSVHARPTHISIPTRTDRSPKSPITTTHDRGRDRGLEHRKRTRREREVDVHSLPFQTSVLSFTIQPGVKETLGQIDIFCNDQLDSSTIVAFSDNEKDKSSHAPGSFLAYGSSIRLDIKRIRFID